MTKLELLDALKTAHDEYFRVFIQNYPTIPKDGPFTDFGPPELCDLAIEAHACLIALGENKRKRFVYLGFDVLMPFDNPVDLFNWRKHVKENRVDHTIYASIAIRIDSEIKRLRNVIERGGEAEYDQLPVDVFLVSKDRYASVATAQNKSSLPAEPNKNANGLAVQISNVYISNANDSAAVNGLEELEKKSTIWSNVSNVISTLRTIFLG